jgi:hypothetical protein
VALRAEVSPLHLYRQQAARHRALRPVVFVSKRNLLGASLIVGFALLVALVMFVPSVRRLLFVRAAPEVALDLVGAIPQEVQQFLGEPAAMRREATAQIWQYHTGECVLDIYLYGEVRHAEVRARQLSATADAALDRQCLTRLRAAHERAMMPAATAAQ